MILSSTQVVYLHMTEENKVSNDVMIFDDYYIKVKEGQFIAEGNIEKLKKDLL